jgi:hypothetical protein
MLMRLRDARADYATVQNLLLSTEAVVTLMVELHHTDRLYRQVGQWPLCPQAY